MSESGANSWSRPWTTDQIIKNAPNWSLAGDAGLLKYLESFSQDMFTKAEETNKNLNKLLEDLDSTSLSLNTAKNEFSSLRNVQFVESRVYEEDETLVLKQQQEEVKVPRPTDEEKKKEIRDAILKGINVVDKYFEKVEVPDSDSEDETDFPNFVLRPKDPYIDRPLPYVIGTEQWHKKWHVGLLDSSSESEADKVSEKFSESDSESDLPISNRNYVKGTSISGSEVDLSARNNINPVANSTFDEATKPELFGSSDSDDYNSVPVQAPISNKTFAQELAAKLGDVIEQNMHVPEPEVNKRPIQAAPPTSHRIIGNLFSDEPPPIDEDNDMFGQKGSKGIFSGGALFDDLESSNRKENIIPPKEATKPALNLFDDEEDDFLNVATNPTAKTIRGGLFDDDSSEDDLFKETKPQKSLLPPHKVTVPFFSDEPPELEPKSSESPSKKPVGGVKIFGDASVLEQQKINRILKMRQESSESSEREENAPEPKPHDQKPATPSEKPPKVDQKPDITPNKQAVERSKKLSLFDDGGETPSSIKKPGKVEEKLEKPNQISLFGDDDDLFEKDLFSAISTKKFTSSLFDDDSFKDDLFETLDSSTSPEKTPQSDGLFAPLDQGKQEKPAVISTLEKPAKDTPRPSEPPKDNQKPSEPPKEKKVSLFSDESDEGDDLFANINLSKNESKNEAASGKEAKPANISFFDEPPPDDEEEWETKSDNLFEENDQTLFDNIPEVSTQRSGLFDNEPPSLFSESSGIVRDASTRVEPDESFNPYASSSRRFSSDIFNEQQSNDSFFVTKSKSGIEPALGKIPEFVSGSLSNTDITPSGNPDDLFSDSSSRPLESDLFGSELLQNEKSEVKAEKSEKSRTAEPDDLFSDSVAKPFESDLFSSSQKEEKTEDKDERREGDPKSEVWNEKAQAAEAAESIKRAALPKKKDVDSPSFDTPPLKSPEANDQDSSYHTPNENLPGPGEPEVLPSITKDRARIPVKRRPSTRKARQESIRKSGVDFKINPEPEKDDSSGTPESSIFDEFATAEQDSSKEPSLQADSLRTNLSKTSFLFDSPDSDTSLFSESSASKIGPSEKNSLFGDESRASEPKPRKDEESRSSSSKPLFDEGSRSSSAKPLLDEKSRSTEPRPRRDRLLDGENKTNEPRKDPLFDEESRPSSSKVLLHEGSRSSLVKPLLDEKNRPTEPRSRPDRLFDDEIKSDEPRKDPLFEPDDSLFGTKIGSGASRLPEDSLFGEESRPSDSKPRKDPLFGEDSRSESKPRKDPLFGQESQPSESNPKKDPLFNQQSKPSESRPRKDLLFGQESQPSESKPTKDPLFDQKSQPSESKPRNDPLFGHESESKPRKNFLFEQESRPSEPKSKKDPLFGEEHRPSESKKQDHIFVESKPQQKAPDLLAKSGLFDDDDFDDLFSSKKLPPKSNVLKKSLFEDDLDDDDIFGASASAKAGSKSAGEAKLMQKKTVKAAQVKKLENTAATDDPLSSFND